MMKRVVAAIAAIALAIVGIAAVISYANRADERAIESLDTVDVLVVQEPIRQGLLAEDLSESVNLEAVPRAYVVDDAIDDLADVEGQILAVDLQPGEQLRRGRFATEQDLRARGATPLPEEAADLHQVTIPLNNPRALGGNVSPGDRVGVFMSFAQAADGYMLELDGSVAPWGPESETPGADIPGDDGSPVVGVGMTHLSLHKVLVARVEGGYVAPAAGSDDEDGEQEAANTVNVTLALEASDAERLVYAAEFGRVWLSLEPDSASEDGTGVVTLTIPNEARRVYE